ncbi:DUF3426 domain-containing protein [Geobacter sp. SVR]|uniref:DUF3426 domain-containing protein n=1 Tax=Geobacter sp. SVR TaxID=2495594 RepID=UPI00143EFEF3|nr:DUF3426 domain-containing protein [Geobacter sp. SVR]BCS52190.1 hypothetical protein GSVR_04980 [Geobacter sp. SVR]GCF85148.1 hypothetical protein GSbR_17480 [Geobacter sp. SVR]
MIIQCERCNTKFRLDDSKVTDKGVKVRCARCRHIFSVTKEQPEDTGQADFGTMLEAASAPQEPFSAASAPDAAPEDREQSTGPFFDSPFDSDPFEQEASSEALRAETESFEPGGEERFPFPGNDDFDFSPQESKALSAEREEQSPSGDTFDFGSFDFGSPAADAGTPPTTATPFPDPDLSGPQETPPTEPDNSFFDFDDENLFGKETPTTPAGVEPAGMFTFDEFRLDEMTPPATGQAGNTVDAAPDDSGKPEPEAEAQVTPEAVEHAHQIPFAPSATADKTLPVPLASGPAPEEDELPPLSISSRRKRSPLLAVLLGLLGVVTVAAVCFFSFALPDVKAKSQAATDTGRITIRSVDASFVTNKESGELLVITGEAVNNFKEPRAAIQLKAMIYGAAGQVLTSRNAYAGNALNKEQLTTQPMDKLEAAMANQFGDSLANLEVAPGKAIPFTIVIPKPAADAKDYGVEPAGSTVATGKQ